MSKILGLDLGTNSIGWAYTDLTQKEKRTLRKRYQRELILQKRISKKEATFFKIKNLIQSNFRTFSLIGLTTIMFLLSIFLPDYWELFLNMGIVGMISILTFEKKNEVL